jgi:ABC-type nitrate/sulfonate/bicarbonate transport system ATPase subunit
VICLRNVYAGYPGHEVLENISLAIQLSGRFAVTGPSGCGKTTLLKLLGGLLLPGRGQVTGLKNLRVSFLFQENRLLPWRSALENVLIAMPSPDRGRAEESLNILGLSQPNQYPRDLSGGMQRRVALARAMCFPCDLLLLDEPFTGMDGALRDQIAPFVLACAPTVVMATHDPEDIIRMRAVEIPMAGLSEQ